MNPIEKIENAQKRIRLLAIGAGMGIGCSAGIQMAFHENLLTFFGDLLPAFFIIWMGRIASKALTDLRGQESWRRLVSSQSSHPQFAMLPCDRR